MVEVGLSELQADFGSLLEKARGGEDVLTLDGGEPVARLDPIPRAVRMPRWDPAKQTFAERVAEVQAKFAIPGVAPMSEAEFQAEMDIIRGRD